LIGTRIVWLIIAIIVIVVLVYVVNWLYHRSSKEVPFVRASFQALVEKGQLARIEALPSSRDIRPNPL
jgi:uncharacterized membrane protein YcaP (DUF421 family)